MIIIIIIVAIIIVAIIAITSKFAIWLPSDKTNPYKLDDLKNDMNNIDDDDRNVIYSAIRELENQRINNVPNNSSNIIQSYIPLILTGEGKIFLKKLESYY